MRERERERERETTKQTKRKKKNQKEKKPTNLSHIVMMPFLAKSNLILVGNVD
jgi:hypothetical protein